MSAQAMLPAVDGPGGVRDQGATAVPRELLLREYEQINGHLRTNIQQFVNWFSFFLMFSFVAMGVFAAGLGRWPQLRIVSFEHAVPVAFLLMHMLAFVAILIFRRYISTSDHRVKCIAKEIGDECLSPIPARFCQWMTDLMAAAYVVAYFAWLFLLLVR